ncbi:MAG: hypothetical protein HFF28_06080 [Oscillospiraceae bacterium]|nr:hypothetical protein [Oscillospiraceae bacterium]
MKKRLLALLLAGAMCVGLAACGNADKPSDSSKAPEGTASTAPEDGGKELTIEEVWPSGTTVYIDVPAKAGGGTDLYTRYLTQALGEVCPGVNFVVTNYDTTEVGREHAKNADPDGKNFIIHHAGWALEYQSGSTNVNPTEDLKVVGVVNLGGPQAIIAKPDAPYKNFTELGEYINAHPGEVVIGCSLGGASQGSIYKVIEGLGEGYTDKINWVQCGSEADKLTQTASGSIDIANCSIPNAQAYEADGKLTILGTAGPAVATLENMSELVGLDLGDTFKTAAEQGISDAEFECSYYIWAPLGTPDNICKAVNGIIMKATEQQSFIDGNKQMATFVDAVDFETAQKTLAHEWDVMSELAEGMGVKTR